MDVQLGQGMEEDTYSSVKRRDGEGGKGKEQLETSGKLKMQLPACRVPAVEIVRAGEGERNAKAGGEEEEQLQHFSQLRPLHQPFWGFRGHAREGRGGCHCTQPPSPFWVPSQECWIS